MKFKKLIAVLSLSAVQLLFFKAPAAHALVATVSAASEQEQSSQKAGAAQPRGEVVWDVALSGYGAGGTVLPFWARTNRHGLVPEVSGGLLTGGAHLKYSTKPKIDLYAGLSLAGNAAPRSVLNASAHTLSPMIDELYFGLAWRNLRLDVGMIDRVRDPFNGLSLTNGNIVLSGNSRNFLGYNLATGFMAVPFTKKVFSVKVNFADYKLLDNRYVSDVLLHNQSCYMKFAICKRMDFIIGIEFWSQWAGVMPASDGRNEVFRQPSGFKDYLRVITFRSGGSDATASDQANVLGNHLGRELISLDWKADKFKLIFQHDIPFEDGSGMGFQNFPDGVNTLAFSFNDKNRWVSDIIYESVFTKCQSGKIHDRPARPEELESNPTKTRYIVGGRDNYFNHGEYRSGWTYYGNTIGLPLITPADANADGIVLGVVNNRLTAHHLGIAGMICKKLPYRLMATYSRNFGTYSLPFEKRKDQLSLAMDTTVPRLGRKLPLALTVGLYGDMGELYPDNFGLSLKLHWHGSVRW